MTSASTDASPAMTCRRASVEAMSSAGRGDQPRFFP